MDKGRGYSTARRALLLRLGMAGALGASGMLGVLRAALAAGMPTGIRSIKGSVTVDGQPAEVGQQILPGQKVVTAAGAEAIFVVGKDAFLQHENSEFMIERGERGAVPLLRYLSGKVLSVFGKGRKQLATPTATIGIRGTGCYIEAEDERTYFCLCYGTAVVRPKGNPKMRKLVRTRHHEQPLYIGHGAARDIMQSARVINHTDDELIMLEELVGRLPPFYGKDYKPYE
jgi:hypothetical protein